MFSIKVADMKHTPASIKQQEIKAPKNMISLNREQKLYVIGNGN